MPWWGKRRLPDSATLEAEARSWSLADPATARLLGDWGGHNYSGESVTETSALSLSGFYRAVSLVSQAIAALPLKSYRTVTSEDGETRERVPSFLDNPAGPDSLTPFEWKERVVLHLLIHGNAYLYHLRNDAGAIVGLYPIHPRSVEVVQDDDARGGKYFLVSMLDGSREEVANLDGMTHILGPVTDGLVGYSPLTVGRNSLGTGLAADRSAASMFANGTPVRGAFVTAAGHQISARDIEDITNDLDTHLDRRLGQGKVPIFNRVLEWVDWNITNADAQWMEARAFNIEEISRWTGVPPFLLMQLDKQTSWGTGIAEQNKNLSQFVLLSWCKRITEHLSRLLSSPRHAEFDMAGLEAGSAAEEINLLMAQVNGGFLTLNEARRVRNLAPVPGGDALRVPSGVMLQAQLEADAEAISTDAQNGTGNEAPDGA